MAQQIKGIRKDTPANLRIPNKLRHQLENVKSEPSFEEEPEEDLDKAIIEQNQTFCQPAMSHKTIENTTTRTRKPTPAHGQTPCLPKAKSLSFNVDILEEEEEDENERLIGTAKISASEGPLKSSYPKVLRKDTPAAIKRNKLTTKTRSLCSQDSIAEEDENGDVDLSEDKMMSYRLRKESILLCSHPSLDDISWKETKVTVNPR